MSFPDPTDDNEFMKAGLQVATGTVRNGASVFISSSAYAVESSIPTRAAVASTALMFQSRAQTVQQLAQPCPHFWVKLAEVSPELYLNGNNANGLRLAVGASTVCSAR